MVRPVYELTPGIDINIVPSHQAGEEQGNIGGVADLLLGDIPADNRAGN